MAVEEEFVIEARGSIEGAPIGEEGGLVEDDGFAVEARGAIEGLTEVNMAEGFLVLTEFVIGVIRTIYGLGASTVSVGEEVGFAEGFAVEEEELFTEVRGSM